MTKKEKEMLVRKIIRVVPVEDLQALLTPRQGLVWEEGKLETQGEIDRIKDVLRLHLIESQQQYAELYQSLLVMAAVYGPRDKTIRETIRLMLDITKEARSSSIEYQKVEFVDRLREVWEIMQEAIFADMSAEDRKKIFGKMQEILKERNLPYKLLQITKKTA